MAEMGFRDYAAMVTESPVKSMVVEYRQRSDGQNRLVAATLTDIMEDGLSMVYSFFDPRLSAASLGSLMVLEHIQRAVGLGLPHVYLGYWVENSPKMQYKKQYQPLEVLKGKTWQAF